MSVNSSLIIFQRCLSRQSVFWERGVTAAKASPFERTTPVCLVMVWSSSVEFMYAREYETTLNLMKVNVGSSSFVLNQ